MYRKSGNHGRRPAWMYKGLPAELQHKKEVYKKWKHRWAARRNRETLLEHAGLV